MERYIKPRPTTVNECSTEQVGPTVRQHAEEYLLEWIHTDSGCNSEAIAIKK